MKFAIISDVHANAEALRATLTTISKLAVNRIVCLGDVVGYNANPAECVNLFANWIVRWSKAITMRRRPVFRHRAILTKSRSAPSRGPVIS